jgi:hypothetical protein
MDSWILSWENHTKGMFRLGFDTTGSSEDPVAAINHYYLDNHGFERFMQIDGISPMFNDQSGEIINALDHRFETLSKKENIDFMIQRMKECEITPYGWAVNSGINVDGQFEIFLNMVEIFVDESNNEKYRTLQKNGFPKFVKFMIEPNHDLPPIIYPAGGDFAAEKVAKEMRKHKVQKEKALKRKEKLEQKTFYRHI